MWGREPVREQFSFAKVEVDFVGPLKIDDGSVTERMEQNFQQIFAKIVQKHVLNICISNYLTVKTNISVNYRSDDKASSYFQPFKMFENAKIALNTKFGWNWVELKITKKLQL